MQNYAQAAGCYMGYLTAYLGDSPGYHCGVCGHCQTANFPQILPSPRIQGAAAHFFEEEFLPRIEKQGSEKYPLHEAGYSLSYYGGSRTGRLVRASKYEGAGPFALTLVQRAVEVIRTYYPLYAIHAIVSVPPTKSGLLVETFARQVAATLGVEYLPVLVKLRPTQEQKELTNWVQKATNVKNAFAVQSPEFIAGRTLLLIDDIYDSGYILREVAKTLMQAGARAVYPLTITRTNHSDNQ
jgi:ATP-dependent DNA helicase RecQ